MAQAINIKSMSVDPALLDLPWNIPLEQWPPEVLAALPRGISRHIVRFVNLNSNVIAVKEISSFVADREYEMLRDLLRLGAPVYVQSQLLPAALMPMAKSSTQY